jgi:hypothetical protein
VGLRGLHQPSQPAQAIGAGSRRAPIHGGFRLVAITATTFQKIEKKRIVEGSFSKLLATVATLASAQPSWGPARNSVKLRMREDSHE